MSSHPFYKRVAWHGVGGLRDQALQRDGYTCQRCGVILTRGRTRATDAVVHHKKPHRGDWRLFCDVSNLEAVCKKCHDGALQAHERGRVTYGADGWPVQERPRYNIPYRLEHASCPVVFVFGAPASGKSTYIKDHAGNNDRVIDLDQILLEMYGARDISDFSRVRAALKVRDDEIRSLSTETRLTWVPMMGKTREIRREWVKALGPNASQVVLNTPSQVCIERLKADKQRAHVLPQLIAAVNRWQE